MVLPVHNNVRRQVAHVRRLRGQGGAGCGTPAPICDAVRSARLRTASRMAALDEIVVSVEKKALGYWGGSGEKGVEGGYGGGGGAVAAMSL